MDMESGRQHLWTSTSDRFCDGQSGLQHRSYEAGGGLPLHNLTAWKSQADR